MTEPNLSPVDPLIVGENIRKFRRSEGMTLKELSSVSGVSIATISKIENGKISGGFETIYKIARGLGVLVTEIMVSGQSDAGDMVIHKKDASGLHATGLYDYFPQAYRRQGTLNPYIMVIHTHELPHIRDWSIHQGEEVIIVLSGEVELHIEGRELSLLAAGDSACFDSGARHAFVCASKLPARIVSVSTRGPTTRSNGKLAFS